MAITWIQFVRLNLFNQVLAVFCAKFAFILVIRYSVFMWDLCKDCVWESVKKTQDMCNQRSLVTGSRYWLATGKSPKWHPCEACRELKGPTTGALQDKMYSLAKQFACDSNSWLVPLARLSCQNALFGWKLTFHIPHIHYYKYPYTHEM